MKEKLEKIREAMETTLHSFHAAVTFDSLPKDGETINKAHEALALIDSIIAELDSLPMVQLDKYYPKLANEAKVKLFISDEDFGKIIKVRKGYMVPILALNAAIEAITNNN